ncbi:MAG: 3-isopropylmalate dehydratase small subunit [SAR202 cluster bacterium]|nr:3-isopropylmalate dehydratase small subunit [SAR202 cluster bacterium]|tara:strand:+ start:713 stop:1309 length:597 start_codon:yes stop_codon:yes gene_type:complete
MEKFTKINAIVAPLDRENVDTDQIIPKQFLKRIERTGFGEFAFFDWRYLEDGAPNPDFILNQNKYKNAEILVSGRNFGSGSSREHAPWALKEMGFSVIIAPSFADIFKNNCMQNGLLPVILDQQYVELIMARSIRNNSYKLTVDLENQTIVDEQDLNVKFNIDPFRKNSLLKGLDDVGITLTMSNDIDQFENKRIARW